MKNPSSLVIKRGHGTSNHFQVIFPFQCQVRGIFQPWMTPEIPSSSGYSHIDMSLVIDSLIKSRLMMQLGQKIAMNIINDIPIESQ
jgi:hypothetical protein